MGYVCEPVGTRTTLVKIVGGQTATFTRAQIDNSKIPPAVGVSTQAATAVCKANGYTDYVAGTITSTQPFDCGYAITRWNGTAFYNDNACYNPILQALQCWK